MTPLSLISNFSGGPGALAQEVLEQASQAIIALPETGISVLGMSHRSDWFEHLITQAQTNLRELLDIPENYHVLFLQGGGSLQFSMIPMNFLHGQSIAAQYLETGYWSAKSIPEARLQGPVEVVWSGRPRQFRELPNLAELALNDQAPYVHYVSNETVEGLAFQNPPSTQAALVCDMSSDLLSRPIDVSKYALIYAHAQKNLGPAGVTVVIIRDDFLLKAKQPMPAMLDYRQHIDHHSIYNTPPVFAIYVLTLVTQWLKNTIGGLQNMQAINQKKSALLLSTLHELQDKFSLHARMQDQSIMNVCFNLTQPERLPAWLAQAQAHHLHGLQGHRSLGGIRASLYNAVTLEDVRRLCQFLRDAH